MNRFTRGLDPKEAMDTGYSNKISKIINGVLEVTPDFYDNPNGPYESTCIFCGAEIRYGGERTSPSMEELPHTSDCIWVMAKEIKG